MKKKCTRNEKLWDTHQRKTCFGLELPVTKIYGSQRWYVAENFNFIYLVIPNYIYGYRQ